MTFAVRRTGEASAVLGAGIIRRRRALETDERAKLEAIARIKDGDPEALEVLYVRYASQVHRYTESIVRNPEDAADLTQQLFLRLPTALRRYDSDCGSFSSWVMRVAHNAAIDHLRAARTIACGEVVVIDGADRELARTQVAELRSALEALSRDERQVILLRFLVGLTPGEVATRMGRTEQAIHSLQHRARRALRAELTRMQAGPAAMSE